LALDFDIAAHIALEMDERRQWQELNRPKDAEGEPVSLYEVHW